MTTGNRIPEIRSIIFDPGKMEHSPEDRIEVALSPALLNAVASAAEALVRQLAHPVPGTDNIEKQLADMRHQYQDVCTQLAHRVKTDLSADEITFLHFALIKGVMTTVRDTIREYCNARKQRAEELRQFGSGELLKVQDELAWFYRHADLVNYRVMKGVLQELRRVENRHLHGLWQDTAALPFDSAAMLFIPLMAVGDRPTDQYLLDHLFLSDDFTEQIRTIIDEVENCCQQAFPDARTLPLFDQQTPIITVTNELSRPPWANFLSGGSDANRRTISEQFCWLDDPDAVKAVFNPQDAGSDRLSPEADAAETEVASNLSLRERWHLKRLTRRLERLLRRQGIQAAVLATEQTRRLWPNRSGRQMAYRDLYHYLTGGCSLRKLAGQLPDDSERRSDVIRTLRQARKELRQELRRSSRQITLDSLALIARFRSHLKYCRFSQRMFNSVDLIPLDSVSPQQPHQYVLLSADEIRASDSNPVAHECLLTLRIANLEALREHLGARALEADVFLARHFFDPLRQQADLLGAEQQYRDDHCWQLLLREYHRIPEKWHTVSHATALAQQMLERGEALRRQCLSSQLPQPVFSLIIDYHDIVAGIAGSDAGERFQCGRQAVTERQANLDRSSAILTPAAFRKLQQEVMMRQVTRQPGHRTDILYSSTLVIPQHARVEAVFRETPCQDGSERETCYELLRQAADAPLKSAPRRYQPRPMMLQPDR